MRVGVGLLVVLPGPALQSSVLDDAVVAHLGELQVCEVLADALIDQLVVPQLGVLPEADKPGERRLLRPG